LTFLNVSGGAKWPLTFGPVFENTYFTFFSDLKKHDFTFFCNNVSKSRKKSQPSTKFAECLNDRRI